AGLDLQQRGDQDQELAARIEVDLVARREVLDERDDDVRDVDLGRLELLLEDEGEEEVERALERVEVQLEVANRRRHGGESSRAVGRARPARPSSASARRASTSGAARAVRAS